MDLKACVTSGMDSVGFATKIINAKMRKFWLNITGRSEFVATEKLVNADVF